jgi:hypothetical protein
MRAAAGATEIKDYGLIDQRITTNTNYPPHAFQNPAHGKAKLDYNTPQPQQQQALSKIPNPSRLPTSGLQKPSIPGPQTGLKMPKTVACPVPDNATGDEVPASSTGSPARSCSLPRQKRDEVGPSNVAVVSPMPNSASAPKMEAGLASDELLKPPAQVLPVSAKSQDAPGLAYLPFASVSTTMAAMVATGRT